jgi:hypothetical protein
VGFGRRSGGRRSLERTGCKARSAIDRQKIARHREQAARRAVKVGASEETQEAEATLSKARFGWCDPFRFGPRPHPRIRHRGGRGQSRSVFRKRAGANSRD